jgi:MtaA/CmuA family methyltransferase
VTTAAERLSARLKGEPVDRIPNMSLVMQFAAQHIGAPLSRYYQDYNVLCESNFATAEAYGLDTWDAISDPYRETADFGAVIFFPEDDLPLCREPLLKDPADLKRLPSPDPLKPGSRMRDRVDAIRLFHQRAGGQMPIQGWVEGALAEAATLRGVMPLLYDLYDRPEWVEQLLEHCVEVAIAFALAQVEAGATIIGLGDAIASQIGPKGYRRFALPYEQRIFEAVQKAGAIGRLHICGNTTPLVRDMAYSGARIIDLDWMVDLGSARRQIEEINSELALCGNFDPVAVLYQGGPDDVKEATRRCKSAGGPNWLAAPGCEVPRYTTPENMLALREALCERES